MTTLTYFGHSAVALQKDNCQVLIDPFLHGNPLAGEKVDLTVQPNYIVVTHAHSDHLGDAIAIAKRSKAKIIANFEIASYAQKKGCEAEPMHIGGAVQMPFGRVKLTQAFHGSTLEEDGRVITLGNPCGVVVSMGDTHVYHAGDTGLFGDMRLIGEDVPLTVALLPIGDRFTMGVKDAIKAASFLKAKLTVPIHYNTFGMIQADPQAFVDGCKANGNAAQIVAPRTSIEI